MIQTISATELARNLSRLLDRLAAEGGELVIERNARPIARLIAAPAQQTAVEAMSDLYRTLSPDAGARWLADSRSTRLKGRTARSGIRNPWRS